MACQSSSCLCIPSFSFTSAGGYPVMWQAGLPPAAASSVPWSSSLCNYRSNSLGIKLEVNWSILQLLFQKEEVPVVESTGLQGQPVYLLKKVHSLFSLTIVEKSEEMASLPIFFYPKSTPCFSSGPHSWWFLKLHSSLSHSENTNTHPSHWSGDRWTSAHLLQN